MPPNFERGTLERKRKRKRVIWGIILLLFILIGSGAVLAWNNPIFGRRLPQISVPASVSQAEAEIEAENTNNIENGVENESETDSSTDIIPAAIQEEATPESGQIEAEALPICGGPESMNVLVLVIDKQAQADVIRLVHVDFVGGRVHFTAIPRDFYVPIVDMAEHGITQGRINATFGYGEKFNGMGEGIFSLARNITENFGVTFDRYVVLNKYKIDKYVDFVGGVDIYLEKPVADDSQFFPAGDVHLDGKAAIDFLSIRYFDDDFHRIRRQNMFIENFFNKVMNELSITQQMQLAMTMLMDKSIQTDFTAKDISPMICLARAIDREKILFIEIPSDFYHPATTSSGGNVQIPHDTVAPFLQSVMNGQYEP
jgi:LCP family protein required for cell wall assembly